MSRKVKFASNDFPGPRAQADAHIVIPAPVAGIWGGKLLNRLP